VDEGKWHFHAVCIDLDPTTGLAKKIQLIRKDEDQILFD
jgi:calcineurin-like phosphoesterase